MASHKEIKKHYEKCFLEYGDCAKGVDWPSEKSARIRYSIMADLLPRCQSFSILDFGCGAGHFLSFLEKNYDMNKVQYTGLDSSSIFIDFCKKKFNSYDFICNDVIDDGWKALQYDFIIMNGVFTERLGLSSLDMEVFMKRVLKIVWEHCGKGMAFNVMSKVVDWERDDLFHYSLDHLDFFLKNEISRNTVYRSDYGLYEYTAYVFKEVSSYEGKL